MTRPRATLVSPSDTPWYHVVSRCVGSALWFVAGLGMSVREWALREGWAGKAISLHEVKGILIAGLGLLARYYGYKRSGNGRHRRTTSVEAAR